MYMDAEWKKKLMSAQRAEITEYHIYTQLADRTKDENNAAVLRRIGNEEKKHADYWKTKTGVDVQPNGWKIFKTVTMARFLGLSFVLKQMEKNEGTGSKAYDDLANDFPETKMISEDEKRHEKELLNMLDEEGLKYVGSIVLGLNDALVELTGALAGFTLALSDNKIISLVGLVTGISAALSMAASDYLSSKAEGDDKAKKSAVYTGVAYFFTVILLILPFLLLTDKFIALPITLAIAVLIIFGFNYYISVAKDLNFKARFFEMTFISLGVATFSFLVGYGLKLMLGVNV
jgi:VIT1/CCC1 family predicted Fe2+/Mn2+ transporter